MIQRFTYGSRQYKFHVLNQREHIARRLQTGFYEQTMLEAIKDLNLPGTYVDVGAHLGNHTVYFANECPSARVIAIEPSADSFRCLQLNSNRNIFRSPIIELHQCAAGEMGQRVRVIRRNTLNTGMDQCAFDAAGQEVRSIDSILSELQQPLVVLKLDVEGFEEYALRGALRSIKKFQPLLVIEGVDRSAIEAQEAILKPLGYERGKRWNSTATYFWAPKTDICVVIPTFNRPNELLKLLEDIHAQKKSHKVLVLVFDDCSNVDYQHVRSQIEASGWIYSRTEENFGKPGFWRLFNLIFSRLKAISFNKVVFLQDDMRLCSSFFERALSVWNEIGDRRKIALNLHIDQAREDSAGWTKVSRVFLPRVELSGWIDCLFLCERTLFRQLAYRLDPIGRSRWKRKPHLGSGVGEQMTRRLSAAGWHMYRVRESMLYHSLVPSKLNPIERVMNRCATVRFADGFDRSRRLISTEPIIASMATIPSRVRLLEATVKSLLHQVDGLNVYLNDFKQIPRFLHSSKIHVTTSQECGDLGDAGKFWWADQARGYHFTVDDDILYPPEYCAVLIHKIEQYDRKAVVGVHAAVLKNPFCNYFRDRKVYHFQAALLKDSFVHILGTGTLAFHHSSIGIGMASFPVRNMADICFAVFAQRNRLPLLAIARARGWLVRQIQKGPSIYRTAKQQGGIVETKLITSIGAWRLHTQTEKSTTTAAASTELVLA